MRLLKRDGALYIHNIGLRMKCIFLSKFLDTFIRREQYLSKVGNCF
jgi:hypothetical protein